MRESFCYLATHHLRSGLYQPRKEFNQESLRGLEASIRTYGIIEPLLVKKISDACYEIIAGERRWRAAVNIGLKKVPCLIKGYTDAEMATISLIENLQREDLSPLEEAYAYQNLMNLFNYTQETIAEHVGKSRSHVANTLRLLQLDPRVKTLLNNNDLSVGHAKMLIGLSPDEQWRLATLCIRKHWSCRTLEHRLKSQKALPRLNETTIKNHFDYISAKLGEILGYPVDIEQTEEDSGFIKIKYYDQETLEGLLQTLGFRYD